nr:PASTA domain protein [uncultured bacterium]AIA17015.1 FAD binding domain protein [uncultured bacterium]
MQPPDRYIPTRDLATFHGVPKEYLSKALQALAQAGLVESTLGPSGGYRLSRKPEDITFLDIVEAIEGPRNTFACTNIIANNPCLDSSTKNHGVCQIARVMHRADEAWRAELRAMTIARLTEQLKVELPGRLLQRNQDWFLQKD